MANVRLGLLGSQNRASMLSIRYRMKSPGGTLASPSARRPTGMCPLPSGQKSPSAPARRSSLAGVPCLPGKLGILGIDGYERCRSCAYPQSQTTERLI
jgi:hypothetical protein